MSDPKTGRSYQLEVPEEQRALLAGKRIGETMEGDAFGLAGYKLLITGGSDDSGFPMRMDVAGARKMKALLSGGVGFNPKRKGMRRKKMLRGNTITPEIMQVNAKISEYGGVALEEVFKKEEGKEEKKE